MRSILISILASISFDVFAISIFDKKLDVYICKSEAEATACNSCIKEKNTKAQYKVNINSHVVLMQIYENGKLYSSSTLDSCKVVNEKNWDCSSYKSYGNGGYNSTKSTMNNGVHSHSHESLSIGIASLNIPSSQNKSYMCVK